MEIDSCIIWYGYLVGTMIEIGKNKFSLRKFKELLSSPKENVQIYKAPPNGLILKKITLNQKIPFGVFLVTSGLLVWYFGDEKIFEFLKIPL